MPGSASGLGKRSRHQPSTAPQADSTPSLLRRMRALPWAQIPVASREKARGHGRVETRAITVVSLQRCPDLGGEFFPHAAQAIKLVHRRRRLGSRKWTTVTVYAITSLTAFQADPVLLARWIRGHWAIEVCTGSGT